ncbi:MAG: rod shape-determining protein [Lachnospiraceae bacterium]|nr:rod shape-determining protein [Lachnospiraceae bacterium]
MSNNLFGVDLGTQNIKMFSKGDNMVLTEKNTIAIRNKTELFACGDEAYAMYEKAPGMIKVSFPVVNGVIADFNNMQRLAEKFIEKHAKNFVKNCEFIVAVPTDITEVEKRSFYELFFKSKMKPKSVLLCEKPIAAAVGLGLNINEPTGFMIVDMGADTTEISLISLGGLVLSDLIRIGGNHFDEAIITHIKRKYSLVIGQKTAQQLKMDLGSATGGDYGTQKIVGRDVVSGLPVETEITSADVNESIKDLLNSICTAIKMILEKTPPELAKDVIRAGIYLAGGSSNLHDIDKFISESTNIQVNLNETADQCVVLGLNTIVTEKEYQKLAYNLTKKIYN